MRVIWQIERENQLFLLSVAKYTRTNQITLKSTKNSFSIFKMTNVCWEIFIHCKNWLFYLPAVFSFCACVWIRVTCSVFLSHRAKANRVIQVSKLVLYLEYTPWQSIGLAKGWNLKGLVWAGEGVGLEIDRLQLSVEYLNKLRVSETRFVALPACVLV